MKRALLALCLAAEACFSAPFPQVKLQTPTEVSCTTSGVLLIAANVNRKYLLIQNKGSQTVYLAPNAAPTATAGIALAAGQNWEMDSAVGVNAIYCDSGSGTQTITVQEGL